MDFTNYKIAFGAVIGFGFGVLLMSILLVNVNNIKNTDRIKRIIEVNAGQYNSKTSKFEFTDKNVQYIITGVKE